MADESDGIEEAFEGQLRIAVTAAGRVGEALARAREEAARRAQAQSEQAARELSSRFEAEKRAARVELGSVHRSDWWDKATPQQIAGAIEFVNDKDVPAVFCESTVSDKPMQQVVDATDAVFGGTLFVDSLSEADGPVPTYLDLIRYDANTIVAALTGEQS